MNSQPSRPSRPRLVHRQSSSSGFAQRAIGAIRAQSRQLLARGLDTMEDFPRWVEHHQEYSVYSFDVFDTLLRRRIDPPEEVKRLVAQHISECLSGGGMHQDAEAILAKRNSVELGIQQAATSRGLDAVASLDDIMAGTLRAIGAASVLDWQDIVNYELALEKAATEPMPGVRDVLNYLRSKHKRIVALSETYLSSAQMAAILQHHDLLSFVDEMYISCDLGKSKLTGNLFRHLIDSEEGKVVHIGDHYTFDYQIPRRSGITALWLRSRDEQRRRQRLRKLSAGENKLGYVNAIIRSPDKDASALYNLGYDVLGPPLTLFVHSVAELAREEGIPKLFFVARDGFAMKKIYSILQSTVCNHPDFPTGTYLCLGRIPVRLASVDRFTYAQISDAYPYIARFRGNNVSFADILKSYGLEPAHFTRIARQCGVEMDKPIGPLTQEPRLLVLLESADFQETLRAKSDALRRLLRRYLDGIGFMGDKKVAVVDANAEGLTQWLLDRAFASDRDYPAVLRYYFNALKLDHDGGSINLDLPQVRGIFSDWRKDSQTDQRLFFIFGMLIELFAHPNHGVTAGYRDVNGRAVPVFKRTPQESQYELTSQALKGMLSYARDYAASHSLHNYRCEELLMYARDNVANWVKSPPRRDVEGLVSLFMTSDWPVESNQRLIERMNLWDFLTTRGLGRKQNRSLWIEGTRALAPVPRLNSLYRMAAACRNCRLHPLSRSEPRHP